MLISGTNSRCSRR